MRYTTYLFDFDYTLADSSRGIVICFRKVLTKHGYLNITDEQIKRTIGKTLEDSFSILTGITDANILAGYKKEYQHLPFSRNGLCSGKAEEKRSKDRHHLDQISLSYSRPDEQILPARLLRLNNRRRRRNVHEAKP